MGNSLFIPPDTRNGGSAFDQCMAARVSHARHARNIGDLKTAEWQETRIAEITAMEQREDDAFVSRVEQRMSDIAPKPALTASAARDRLNRMDQ